MALAHCSAQHRIGGEENDRLLRISACQGADFRPDISSQCRVGLLVDDLYFERTGGSSDLINLRRSFFTRDVARFGIDHHHIPFPAESKVHVGGYRTTELR